MSKFIENVNEYIRQRKFKNRYISLMTGWDQSKVSRVLNEKGTRGISDRDMKTLAEALGESVEFFLTGTPEDMKLELTLNSQLAFSAGKLSKDDALTAEYVIEMLRYHDALTSF